MLPPPASRPAAAPAPSAKPAPRWLRPAVLALAALALFCMFSAAVGDADTWFHLRTGAYVVQNHKLPDPDPFSWTTYKGQPAYPGEEATRDLNIKHEWGAQVILYLVYAAGGFAGMVLFDPVRVQDKSTYAQPHQYSQGFDVVLVNGQIVVDDGKLTAARPGQPLRHRE